MTLIDERLLQHAFASLQEGALDDADRGLVKFLRRNPRHFGALNLYGILLIRQARYGEAEMVLRRAIGVGTRSDTTFYNYGIVLKKLSRPIEALEAFSNGIAVNPSVPESWNNRGTVLNDLDRFEEAVVDFDRAISLRPDYAEAFLNKGNSLAELELSDNALIAYERALAINPDLAEAWSGRGNVLSRFRRYDDALISFEKASGFKPDLDYLQGARLHAKLQLCDWRDFDGECAALVAGIRAGRLASRPFELLSLASSARDQLECARRFVDSAGLGMTTQFRKRDSGRHDRIHLAYVSADFREHPVSHLIAGVFENHDRARFETTAISLNPTDRSEMRTRLEDSFEHFIDASCDDAQGIARKMRELEVDIAVDLMGHTAGAKLAVFASRPCPIQVNYLGFAATMGASCIDYLIADRVAVPDDQWPNFSESVVCLPDTFMPYDTKLQIFRHPSARADHGLPETAFVFAAFNGSYKITPGVFDIWMQLLNAVDESVLWISRTNETAMRNLRREAEARGVAGTRLIFADRLVRMEDHLARHRLADLFLDTLPYNAHSTANDALWAGLPVLTCRGATFAGRVAASLLHAVGLPELVADSLAEYKALALKLARDPKLLAAIKVKLARNRDVHPLFDTARFTRHLEAAYTTMWEIYQRGETPKSFSVKPITMTTQ